MKKIIFILLLSLSTIIKSTVVHFGDLYQPKWCTLEGEGYLKFKNNFEKRSVLFSYVNNPDQSKYKVNLNKDNKRFIAWVKANPYTSGATTDDFYGFETNEDLQYILNKHDGAWQIVFYVHKDDKDDVQMLCEKIERKNPCDDCIIL